MNHISRLSVATAGRRYDNWILRMTLNTGLFSGPQWRTFVRAKSSPKEW
jgi:hypothetical protein